MDLLASFKPQPKAGADHGHEDDEQLEAIARKIAAMPEKEVAVVVLPALAAEKHDEAEKQAVAAAESWLALVDDGKYGESWDAAADYLKNAVTKDDFVKSLTAARKPLGKLKSREVKSKEYRTSLPGAPDGEYVVIQFKTVFENKKSAIETVTPMLDKDRQVAGERVLHQVAPQSGRPHHGCNLPNIVRYQWRCGRDCDVVFGDLLALLPLPTSS